MVLGRPSSSEGDLKGSSSASSLKELELTNFTNSDCSSDGVSSLRVVLKSLHDSQLLSLMAHLRTVLLSSGCLTSQPAMTLRGGLDQQMTLDVPQ